MGFNADAFLAARRPWTLTVGGRAWPARPVSVQQILDFQAAVQAAGKDERQAQAAANALIRAMFPRRWFGFDPGRWLMRQDAATVAAVLTDFFGHLASQMTAAPAVPTTTTTPPGPPSSPPTRPRLTLGDAELTVV